MSEKQSAGEALCALTATGLLEGYRAGSFNPSDVARAFLSRIERLNPKLHAYIAVFNDSALAAAAESDARYAAGNPRPLEGVPIALKDLVELEGFTTSAGSATRAGRVSTRTATLAKRLLEAGAVILGKLHTVEFAFGAWGDNHHMGTPWNPWDMEVHRTPGGSSSGSGVAVAARLTPWAIGTDTGGSVRVPAAFNGVVGLKTSHGRISSHGVVPLSPALDTPGVLARTVADTALLYATLRGHDDHDMSTWNLPASTDYLSPPANLNGLRFASLSAQDREGITADVLAAYDSTLARLAEMGATVGPIALTQRLSTHGEKIAVMSADAYAMNHAVADDPDSPMDPDVRRRILAGKISAAEYIHAAETLKAQTVDFYARLKGFDAFVLPTTQTPAIRVSEVSGRAPASLLTRFVNQLGLCGVALPSGYSAEGLPLSVQIICRAYDETTALRVAGALEEATLSDRRDPLP